MKSISLLFLAFLCPAIAFADGECSAECPAGQVNVGFADGPGANCACMDQGEGMVEVVPEESQGSEEG